MESPLMTSMHSNEYYSEVSEDLTLSRFKSRLHSARSTTNTTNNNHLLLIKRHLKQLMTRNKNNPTRHHLSSVPIFWFATITICCFTEWYTPIASLMLPGVGATKHGLLGTGSSSNLDGHGNAQAAIDQQDASKAALEAELNSIIQQHDASSFDGNPKLLSEAIISRLMLDNLTSSAPQINELIGQGSDISGFEIGSNGDQVISTGSPIITVPASVQQQQQQTTPGETYMDQQPLSSYTAPERLRLKKLLSMLRTYDMGSGISPGGNQADQAFNQFPVLPASQAATMKRAAMRMSNLLRHQQQQQQRQLSGYGRNNFDFGLGKRPDATSGASNILRFGDSSLGADGHGHAVSNNAFGKRPSAHRFDFGLGKRVASPTYPRYDFGLGKRAPSRMRYDFGLGK